MSKQDPQHFTTAPITLFADWQIFGDVDPHQYMAYKLDLAVEKGDINGYSILVADGSGVFGLLYVYFAVDVDFNAEQLNGPKASGKALLNKIVGDTDVNVRWVGRRVEEAKQEPIVKETPKRKKETPKRKVTPANDDANLRSLVDYLKNHQGSKRADIVENWLPGSLDSRALSRLMDKGKRRGVILSEGRNRAALWYAAPSE